MNFLRANASVSQIGGVVCYDEFEKEDGGRCKERDPDEEVRQGGHFRGARGGRGMLELRLQGRAYLRREEMGNLIYKNPAIPAKSHQ